MIFSFLHSLYILNHFYSNFSFNILKARLAACFLTAARSPAK